MNLDDISKAEKLFIEKEYLEEAIRTMEYHAVDHKKGPLITIDTNYISSINNLKAFKIPLEYGLLTKMINEKTLVWYRKRLREVNSSIKEL